MENVYWIGGGKGGVGKSFASMGLIDYLRKEGRDPVLIETDKKNPDVGRAHKNEIRTEGIDLADQDGWVELLDLCSKTESPVVINSAAGADETQGIDALEQSLESSGKKLVVFWVINRQRDSVELLRDFMKSVQSAEVHVVRNLYFGGAHKFERFNDSKTRKELEERGGMILDFPEIADRIADELYSKRVSIAACLVGAETGTRFILARWQNAVHKMFREAGL
ncbi:MAG: protein mobD [Nitrospirota bacterium]|nr:protein mobD [Nitrospirota bacterium]